MRMQEERQQDKLYPIRLKMQEGGKLINPHEHR